MQPTAPTPSTKPITKNIVIFLFVIMLFSAIGTAAVTAVFTVTDDIYSGVRVGDIDIGGLSPHEAKKKLTAVFSERTQQPPVTIVYGDQRWQLTAAEIELTLDIDALIDQAYTVGRTGHIFQQLHQRYITVNSGHVIPLAVGYNTGKIYAQIVNIAGVIDRDPKSASLRIVDLSLIRTPDAIGHKVNVAKALADIAAQLTVKIPFTLTLAVEELVPAVTARDLEGIDGVIASYSTQFDPNDHNRNQNIALAAKNINGVVVRQGETFSFNTHVGPRLAQNGYKIAPVFIDGRLVPDWGGGVCQVSSTLYNAALLADMAIEERTAHFRPPAYVPLGQDATVADNYLDFRFRNTSPHNIYIISEVGYNQLNIHVLGRLSANPPQINIVAADKKVWEPNTIVKQDPKLDLGKEVVEVEGQQGFQVTTYRVKVVGGREIARELLGTDEYKPEERIVRVGTKATLPKK